MVLPSGIIHTMTHTTILTSKGTTTIPKEIRDYLGIKPGMQVNFTKNKQGKYEIGRAKTIEEVRAVNQMWLKKRGTINKKYQSGDGFTAAVKEGQ